MPHAENNSIVQKFMQFSTENHAERSGTASSYVTAINKLTNALKEQNGFFKSGQTVWDINDEKLLTELYNFVKIEQKKKDGGIFKHEMAKSYWQKGFCSAAVKDFAKFLSLYKRQKQMLNQFNSATDATELAQNLNKTKLKFNPLLLDDGIPANSPEGKSALRAIKVRQNQYVFRKMILFNYKNKCCLTNLPIVEVLRASHISAWAKDKGNRMNPENGLCLSATYDAAFDRHLISFDDKYCLILAPSLKEFCTNKAFHEQFLKLEGAQLAMPQKFNPSKKLLEKHREGML